MRPEAHDLDQLVREWWLRNGGEDVVQQLLQTALTIAPTSLVPSSRALAIIERNELAPTLRPRVGSLRDSLNRLRDYEWQLDQLGDWDNEPEAVFEILGDLAANVKYDPETIRRSRIAHQGSRCSAAGALMETLGWDRLPSPDGPALQLALSDLSEREHYDSWGLFVGGPDRSGIALGIQVVATLNESEVFAEADAEAKEQVHLALHFGAQDTNFKINLEWPATFTGESLGLPLYIATQVARGAIPRLSKSEFAAF
jgi:hypothetical protein